MILGYYGYPYYWGGSNVWGTFDNPAALLLAPPAEMIGVTAGFQEGVRQLRSIKESTGYHIHATDGEVGHVDDFLIGESNWRIHDLLVDTSNWIGGRAVVIPCDAVRHVDPNHEVLHVAATRQMIQEGTPFESIEPAVNVAETGPPFAII